MSNCAVAACFLDHCHMLGRGSTEGARVIVCGLTQGVLVVSVANSGAQFKHGISKLSRLFPIKDYGNGPGEPRGFQILNCACHILSKQWYLQAHKALMKLCL